MSGEVKVRVRKDGQTTEHALAEPVAPGPSAPTLLDRLEKTKARMPYGCRSGACGACLVLVNAGEALLVPADDMERDTLERCKRGKRARLACRALLKAEANGSLELEVPESEETIY